LKQNNLRKKAYRIQKFIQTPIIIRKGESTYQCFSEFEVKFHIVAEKKMEKNEIKIGVNLKNVNNLEIITKLSKPQN